MTRTEHVPPSHLRERVLAAVVVELCRGTPPAPNSPMVGISVFLAASIAAALLVGLVPLTSLACFRRVPAASVFANRARAAGVDVPGADDVSPTPPPTVAFGRAPVAPVLTPSSVRLLLLGES